MRQGLKRAAVFILVFFLNPFLFIQQAQGQNESSTDNVIGSEILGEKLKTSEMDSVQKALDKALKGNEVLEGGIFSSHSILEDAVKGMPMNKLQGLPKTLLEILGKEIRGNLMLVFELFAVMLLGAVIRALQPIEHGIPSEAARLGVNGVIVIIASVSFGNVVSIAATTIESMQNVAAVAMPAMFALMASSGKLVSVTAIQPLMLIGVNAACQIFKTILLPLAVMAGLLFLIDSVSERFKLKTLAKLLKSCTVWITGAITMLFSIAISIQKLASGSVDAVAIKTTKFAIGTFVPVAGKYMSDAAETILLCTSAARNAAGILTVIGLALIVTVPFIKVFVIALCLRLTAAFGSPICDECVCDALEDASGCLSVMLGIMGAALFVLVILTGTLMSSSGFLT